jgi:AraC family transcriptional regulator
MLKTTATISAEACTVELVRGEFPAPLEKYTWIGEQLVVAMMLRPLCYFAEGRFSRSIHVDYDRIGGVFMVPPEHELIGRGSGGEIHVVRCLYKAQAFDELLDGRKHLTREQLRKSLRMDSDVIGFFMRRLAEEATSPGFASETLADSIGSALMIQCARQLFSTETTRRETCRSGLMTSHLRLIEEFVECMDVGIPTVADIAKLCGFSQHYFCQLFRQRTGQSIGRYLANSRLRRAERLLAQTDLPLKEIAYRLGFANTANFTTAFRNEMRMPPGTYRHLKRPTCSY